MLDKMCSVCGAKEEVEIETITNVSPKREDMFPVLLCTQHKAMLSRGELDVQMNEKGDLFFITKKKSR